jgi:hypothetical protein
MKMVVISQKRLDELFKSLCDKLTLETYTRGRVCKCEVICGERPTENMHRHMWYHIHGFKKDLEDA